MNLEKYDKINIEDLEIFANHGVFPEENKLGQKFMVSATLYTDTVHAGRTDELAASIDYGAVSHFITSYMQKHTFKLLEAAAEHLAEEMLCSIAHLEAVPGDQETLGAGRPPAENRIRKDNKGMAYRLHRSRLQSGRQEGIPGHGSGGA